MQQELQKQQRQDHIVTCKQEKPMVRIRQRQKLTIKLKRAVKYHLGQSLLYVMIGNKKQKNTVGFSYGIFLSLQYKIISFLNNDMIPRFIFYK